MRLGDGLTDLCTKELLLCSVQEGEAVAVLSHGDIRKSYADALLAAASRLGAKGYQVRLEEGSTSATGEHGPWTIGSSPIAGNRAVVESLKAADLVVDLITLHMSSEQHEIISSGTRMLLCIEPVDNLRRMLPTSELRERVEAGGELMSAAKTLRFTNEAGSDVTYRFADYRTHLQYGFTDTPGHWDHWPSGLVAGQGADDGVDGRVVLAPGDILLPFKRYVADPVELTIEHGLIVDIRGGLDADLLKDYMESFDDPRGYAIGHIGWGMLESARWSGLGLDARSMHMEARSFLGNVLFSTGPNVDMGGTNDTQCHLDIPMRDCSLYLDDEPVVLAGEVVVDALKPSSSVARA